MVLNSLDVRHFTRQAEQQAWQTIYPPECQDVEDLAARS